jgi:hypothetical protein
MHPGMRALPAMFLGILAAFPGPGVAGSTSARLRVSVRVVHTVSVRGARTLASSEAVSAAQLPGGAGLIVDHRGTALPLVVHHPAPPAPDVAWITVLADGAPAEPSGPLTSGQR